MDRRWVLNSSPIIVLSMTSLMWIVRGLSSEIVVPMAVAREIDEGADRDPAKQWLQQEGDAYVRHIGQVDSVVINWNLGQGESQVISWANRNPSYTAIMDDRAARRCAAVLGIHVLGTVGVLLLAKKHGLIASLGPLLDRVRDSGLRIGDPLVEKALKLAGEK